MESLFGYAVKTKSTRVGSGRHEITAESLEPGFQNETIEFDFPSGRETLVGQHERVALAWLELNFQGGKPKAFARSIVDSHYVFIVGF